MNATLHNQLVELLDHIPLLGEALSQEDNLEHVMVLPTGRWTTQQNGRVRRRTNVLDSEAVEQLATWLAAHPGASLHGTWLMEVLEGVAGPLIAIERRPTAADNLGDSSIRDALKPHITRGENGIILGPVRAKKLDLLCWIAQQFIQEQILLISDRAPTKELGPRVVHLYPPRSGEALARMARLLRRCDAVLWDEVTSAEQLRTALGYPGARRRWVTMDCATPRAGLDALARRSADMASSDLGAVLFAQQEDGQLSHLFKKAAGQWQETTSSSHSLLSLVQKHLAPSPQKHDDFRTTIEAQEVRYRPESAQTWASEAPQDEPASTHEPASEAELDLLLAEQPSEVEELMAQPHVMAASSIHELLEDSETSEASADGADFERFEPPYDTQDEGLDEVSEDLSRPFWQLEPQDAESEASEPEELEGALQEAELEEPAQELLEGLSLTQPERLHISERPTEQIDPEDVEAAVAFRDAEIAREQEQARQKNTQQGDSLASIQDALREVEADIHAERDPRDFQSNDTATNPQIDIPMLGEMPSMYDNEAPITQEFYVEGDEDLEALLSEVNEDSFVEVMPEDPPQRVPEDTQVDHIFEVDVEPLEPQEPRIHLNELLKIEEELRANTAHAHEPTGLHADFSQAPPVSAPMAPAELPPHDILAALDELYDDHPLPPEPPDALTPPAGQDEPTMLTSVSDAMEVPRELSWGEDEKTVQREQRLMQRSLAKATPTTQDDVPAADASSSTSIKLNALSQRLRALRQRRQLTSGQFEAVDRDDPDESPRERQSTNLLDALKRDKKS